MRSDSGFLEESGIGDEVQGKTNVPSLQGSLIAGFFFLRKCGKTEESG